MQWTANNKKISKAKLRLLQVPLLGILSYQFDWVFEKGPLTYLAQIIFDESDITKVLKNQIYFNIDYVEKAEFDFVNLAFLASHEVMHYLNLSMFRAGIKNPLLWNIATDHVIDSFLKKIKTIRPYQNSYNIISKLEKEHPNCSAEFAYNWLIKNNYSSKLKITDGIKKIILIDKDGEEVLEIPADELEILEKLISGDERIKSSIKNFVIEAKSIYDTLKTAGKLPGNFAEYFDEFLKTEIDWKIVLENSLKYFCQINSEERNWRNLNKYYYNLGVISPGRSIEDENYSKLLIAFDSSGSITKKELRQFLDIVNNSAKYYEIINLIVHDYTIKQNEEFKDSEQFRDFVKNIGILGRGGTSHSEVFRLIDQRINDGEEISAIILLTDNYSDIETEYPKFRNLKKVPIINIIPPNGRDLEIDNNKNIVKIRIN